MGKEEGNGRLKKQEDATAVVESIVVQGEQMVQAVCALCTVLVYCSTFVLFYPSSCLLPKLRSSIPQRHGTKVLESC